tara:strand:- start:7666 stop:8034 length:369 start_codon:yes stop_codon:yes gene_type:complete
MTTSIIIEDSAINDFTKYKDIATLINTAYMFYGVNGLAGEDINKLLKCLNDHTIQGKEQLGGSTVYITEEDVYLIDTLHLDTASYNYLMTLGKQSGNVAKLDIEEYTKFKEFVNMMGDRDGQ